MHLRLMLISQVLLLLLVVESSWGLRCLPCDMVECPEKLKCRGGKVLDPCKCCYECARQKGQTCGGAWNLSGTCDKGLECHERRCRGLYGHHIIHSKLTVLMTLDCPVMLILGV